MGKITYVHMVLKATNNPAKDYWSEVAVSYNVLFIPDSTIISSRHMSYVTEEYQNNIMVYYTCVI